MKALYSLSCGSVILAAVVCSPIASAAPAAKKSAIPRMGDVVQVPQMTEKISRSSSWDQIYSAFSKCPEMRFGQYWIPKSASSKSKAPAITPAGARVGWKGNTMYILATVKDADLHTTADKHNLRLWELGDVVEIFLGVPGSPSYIEYQYAPNGAVLKVFWPSIKDIQHAGDDKEFPKFFAKESASWSQIFKLEDGWAVCVAIPASVLRTNGKPLAGLTWEGSICRYDAGGARAGEPTSVSPLRYLSFHDREAWLKFHFQP